MSLTSGVKLTYKRRRVRSVLATVSCKEERCQLSAPSSVFLMLAAAIPAAAQTTLGTIRGTVFDPQQHVVPGATVVVTDESTNVTREAQTDSQGLFEIPNLRPGRTP